MSYSKRQLISNVRPWRLGLVFSIVIKTLLQLPRKTSAFRPRKKTKGVRYTRMVKMILLN